MAELKTSIVIEAQDRFSAAAKTAIQSSGKMSKAFAAASTEMGAAAKTAGKIDKYKALQKQVGQSSAAMIKARQRVKDLSRELKAAERPTKKMREDLGRAQRAANEAAASQQGLRRSLASMGGEMREAGIKTARLSDEQDRLAERSAATERSVARLGKQAEKLGRAQQRAEKWSARMAQASLIAQPIQQAGARARRMFMAPLEAAAEVGRQRGRLASLDMSAEGIDEVVRSGQQASLTYAGIDTAGFVEASYDVRSALSALDDMDVGAVTGRLATLARATDAEIGEITSPDFSPGGSEKPLIVA